MTSLRSFSILISIIIVFLLTVSVVIYFNLNRFITDARYINKSTLTLKEIEIIKGAIKDAQTAHRGFEITGDSTFVEIYNDDKTEIFKTISALSNTYKGDVRGIRKLDTLRNLIEKQFSFTDQIISRRGIIGPADQDVTWIRIDEENMAKIDAIIGRMREAEEVWLLDRTNAQSRSGNLTPIFVLLSFITAVVALGYLFLQLHKTIRVKNATESELEQNLKLLSEEVNEKELVQELLKRVLDSTTNGVMFFRAKRENGYITDLHIVLVNRQIESILGYTREELEGSTLLSKYPGTKEMGLFNKYIDVIENDKELDTEFYYNYEGLNKWFYLTANKQEDGCVVTFADITQRKKNEEELIKKNEALLESNRNLEQFAYVASHDLQEPLRKIRTFSDRIVTKYHNELDEKGRDYMVRMNGAAERMQSLIDDLLKYSRISRPTKDLKKVDLNNLIEIIKLDFETIFQERNVELKVSGLEAIEGDKTQLRQLFQNLISNAIKFTPPERNPEITITGKKVGGKVLQDFDTTSKLNYLRIEVQDNGIGFDQKYAGRIFNIFERLHGKSEIKGTGIGLAVCQKVVQNHKGYIKAEGREGDGAKFIILLPVKQN